MVVGHLLVLPVLNLVLHSGGTAAADATSSAGPTPFDPPLMLWDGPHLRKGRQLIADGTAPASLRTAVTTMNATAYQSLPEYDPGLRPRYYSVMNKTATPPRSDHNATALMELPLHDLI